MSESRSSESIQQQKQLASLLAKRVQNLDPSAKAQFLNKLIDNGHNRQLDSQLLLLLQRSIVSGTSTECQPSDDLENALCAVLDFLFKSLLQPQSFQVSMLSVQCINIFLRKQASIHFPLQSRCLSQIWKTNYYPSVPHHNPIPYRPNNGPHHRFCLEAPPNIHP